MAEVLALTSAIIAIIKITAEVTKIAYQYINDIQKAPESIRVFLNEIQSFTHVLNLLEETRKKNPHLSAVQMLEGPLNECVTEMKMLAKNLEPRNSASWWKRSIVRLKWPLKDGEMSEYLSRIDRLKTTIILAIGATNQSQQAAIMHGMRYVIENNSPIEAKAPIELEKRELILQWLFSNTFDQRHRHTEISKRRQENIGEWLLKSQEFENWTNGTDSRLLWVHGLAGSGKTFMTSFIIDRLQTSQEVYGVAYVYFDYKDQDQQNLTSVLASLGKQLAHQTHQSLPKELEYLYDELSYQQQRPSLEQLYKILLKLTSFFDKTFIICDSLDEYQGRRKELLLLFHRMEGNGIRLFLTSRENCNDVKESFQNSAKIKLCASDKDLASYIELKVRGLDVPAEYKPGVVSELTTCANGMFLLAHFHIKHLYEQNGKDQILKQLGYLKDLYSTTNIYNPLHFTYNRLVTALRRQAPKSVDLGLNVLIWLVKARRTLKVRELQLAVSMHMRHRRGKHFYEKDLPDRNTIVDACANLVTIDDKNDTIKLVHYTVQEYLINNSILPTDADWRIVLACTSYLSLDVFAQGPCVTSGALYSRRELHPFHKYASENLSHHLKHYDEVRTTDIVLSFLKEWGCVNSYLQALHCRAPPSSTEKVTDYHAQYPKQQTSLHIAATLGHLFVIQKLLQKNSTKINAPNDDGKTPILIAAIEGHDKIVDLLLQKGADPSIPDKHGITPLHASIFHDQKSMFMLLLEKGVDPTIADRRGCTPLHWAASRGLERESRILIEKGAGVKNGDDKGRMALHVAAAHGHGSVVQLLLENGAKTSVADKTGNTSLHMAAECGHLDIIQLLLDKGADITSVTNGGNTVLHSAACGGEEKAILAILFKRNIQISTVNNKGCTPLHLAASTGREKIVKLLLERGADVSGVDKEGWTALHHAAEKGHDAVVRTLLENHDNPSSAGKDGATVLHRAVLYKSTVKLLLEKGADITKADNRGRTVLHWACSLEAPDLDHVVTLLLERGASLSHADDEGRTALHFAAFGGHKTVVQLLRKAGADILAEDNRGQTAYQVAVAKKHDVSIIELLKPSVSRNDREIYATR